jgi:hypothetical protein
MDKIILIPFLISSVLLLNREPKEVFVKVFLPSLTLLPVYYDSKIVSGIPEVYFWSSALIPILIAWAYQGFQDYEYHWMDGIILLYIFSIFFMQWGNGTYKEAQKILFNSLLAMYVPFLMTKSFLKDQKARIIFIKTATGLGAIVAIFNLYEFRMFVNVFDEHLRRMWPHSVVWDVGFVMMRSGFKRAMGPFGHPIVAGYFFSLMIPLAIWCFSQGWYKTKNIGKLIVFLNVVGLITSISRAPIMGTFLGLLIVHFGWSRSKGTIGTVYCVLLSLTLLVALPKFITYISVTRSTATTIDQQNVAYRKEMLEAYTEVVMEKPLSGWGRFSVPTIKGMDSIDNEYLGIALQSGLPTLSFYLLFLFGTLIKIFKYTKSKDYKDPNSRLAWCLIAGWISAIFCQGTVYSGGQTVQYLFMLSGLGQALLNSKSLTITENTCEVENKPIAAFNFNRVL